MNVVRHSEAIFSDNLVVAQHTSQRGRPADDQVSSIVGACRSITISSFHRYLYPLQTGSESGDELG